MSFQPKLLVSVRDCEEAASAYAGGADIIDLKEPSSGSLGMASVETIADVLNWRASNHITTPISAALGELAEWETRECSIPEGLSYVKVGLAGESAKGFRSRLDELRSRFEPCWNAVPQWVTVAYADTDVAGSPSVLDIARYAVESQSAGLLIDTFSKNGVPLTEHVSVKQLSDLRAMLNDNDQFFAIAGQIQAGQLENCLTEIQPDIVAVRSAVCVDGNRQLAVDGQAVAKLKRFLETPPTRHATSFETSSTPTSKS